MPSGQSQPPPDFPKIPGIELEREIATGSYAVVYRGRQLSPERPVAVKVLLERSGTDEERSFARFEREGELLSTLRHPGIVEYFGSGVTERGRAYLIMELVDGPNLRDHVDTHGAMPCDVVIALGKRIAEALRHAQGQGIMHRDVKAENILLHRVGTDDHGRESFEAKLADLGLARPNDSEISTGITLKGAIVGTPSIMAPEQFQEVDDIDYRVDIYALGCVMYLAMTGESPFGRGSLPEMAFRKVHLPAPLANKVSPEVSTVAAEFIARMMHADREKRPQTYDELIEFFSGWSKRMDRGVESEPFAPTEPAKQIAPSTKDGPEALTAPKVKARAGCLVPIAVALSGGAALVWSYL